MAAIAITAANVVTAGGGSVNKDKVFGETVTAGQAVYLKSDDRWWLSQCDGTDAEIAVGGIALNGGAANQPAAVQTSGLLTIGGTVAAGVPYYVGRAAGSIVPFADLLSTDKVSQVGYGISVTQIYIQRTLTGVAIA